MRWSHIAIHLQGTVLYLLRCAKPSIRPSI
jgi:hypothetical protein